MHKFENLRAVFIIILFLLGFAKNAEADSSFSKTCRTLVVCSALAIGMSGCDQKLPPAPPPSSVPGSASGAINLPSHFKINEKVLTLTDTFAIVDDTYSYGTIRQAFFALSKSFTFKDAQENIQATARTRLITFGTKIDVKDGSGKLIGSIEEEILKSFLKVTTTYRIEGPNGEILGQSEKIDFLSTDFYITTKDGKSVARIHRPMINLIRDSWTVDLTDKVSIDPRLVLMIAAYKTSTDNDRAAESSSSSGK